MPATLYESLVREYLETENYPVYGNLKMPTKLKIDRPDRIEIGKFLEKGSGNIIQKWQIMIS
jgi:hypothetical protein